MKDDILPTLSQSPDQWQLWLITFLYFGLAIASSIGLFHGLRAWRKSSYKEEADGQFRSTFLFVCTIMLLLRVFFLVVNFPDWENHPFWLYLIILFLPVYLGFWQFSLLILFVVKAKYALSYEKHMYDKCVFPLFHAGQFLLLIGIIIYSFSLAEVWKEHPDKERFLARWDKQPAMLISIMNGLLAALGLFYYRKVYVMVEEYSALMKSGQLKWEFKTKIHRLSNMLLMLPIFLVIFFLRFLWNLLYFYNINPLQKTISNKISNNEFDTFCNYYLVFYTFMEIVPTGVVIWLFMASFTSDDSDAGVPPSLTTPQHASPRVSSPGSVWRASRTSQSKSGTSHRSTNWDWEQKGRPQGNLSISPISPKTGPRRTPEAGSPLLAASSPLSRSLDQNDPGSVTPKDTYFLLPEGSP